MPKLLLKLAIPNIESEFKYRLLGHNVDSKCYLRYYSANNLLAKQIIILTELPDNPGASITNATEYIPEQLKSFLKENYNIELKENAIFIEHYAANHYGDGEEERFALFNTQGKFQHLSVDRLKLIFERGGMLSERQRISNQAVDKNYTTNLDVIALLDSWVSEEADSEEQKDTWEFLERNLRHSPFVVPQIEFWTIYQNLPNYPDKFVALKFITSTRTDELIVKDSLENIREIFEKEGKRRIEPNYDEEPTIIEIWI